jgi:hypothetical protein
MTRDRRDGAGAAFEDKGGKENIGMRLEAMGSQYPLRGERISRRFTGERYASVDPAYMITGGRSAAANHRPGSKGV